MQPEIKKKLQERIDLLKKQLHNASSDLEFESLLRDIKDLERLRASIK